MRRILLYLILIVALCVPGSAGAFRGDDLNLTDEQKAQLKEIWTEAGDEIKPLVEAIENLMVEMEEIVLSDEEIDLGEGSEATMLSAEIILVRTQIMEIKANAKLEAANVLTLEQREIVVEKKKERRERRKKRRNRFEEYQKGVDTLP
jgi:Spy/CpxP family protein refolding chaperone